MTDQVAWTARQLRGKKEKIERRKREEREKEERRKRKEREKKERRKREGREKEEKRKKIIFSPRATGFEPGHLKERR